jgi:hypothetical protein
VIKSSRIRGVGHAVCMRDEYKILIVKSGGKRPLGRPTYGWEDNIKMDVKKILRVWTKFNWLRTVQLWALVNAVIY